MISIRIISHVFGGILHVLGILIVILIIYLMFIVPKEQSRIKILLDISKQDHHFALFLGNRAYIGKALTLQFGEERGSVSKGQDKTSDIFKLFTTEHGAAHLDITRFWTEEVDNTGKSRFDIRYIQISFLLMSVIGVVSMTIPLISRKMRNMIYAKYVWIYANSLKRLVDFLLVKRVRRGFEVIQKR